MSLASWCCIVQLLLTHFQFRAGTWWFLKKVQMSLKLYLDKKGWISWTSLKLKIYIFFIRFVLAGLVCLGVRCSHPDIVYFKPPKETAGTPSTHTQMSLSDIGVSLGPAQRQGSVFRFSKSSHTPHLVHDLLVTWEKTENHNGLRYTVGNPPGHTPKFFQILCWMKRY